MFSEFANVTTSAIIVGLAILGFVLFTMTWDRKRWSARMIANAALCMALSTVLSFIKLYEMPQGGSITPASMLPLLMAASTVVVVPVIILFLFARKYIVRGVARGGLKG